MASLNRGYYVAAGLPPLVLLATGECWETIGLVLPGRADRHHHQPALRIHLEYYTEYFTPSALHRRILADWGPHHDHHRLCCGPRMHRVAHVACSVALVFSFYCGIWVG
jgi:hypothetical protein